MSHLLARDLDHVLDHTSQVWGELRDARLFITGGTGFFGTWLLETLVWAADRLALNLQVTVLTRCPDRFRQKAPHLAAHPRLRFETGDVTSFDFPPGRFSHLIHGAAESATQLNEEDPLGMIETLVAGTRRVLEFARRAAVGKLLLISSGVIYGRQPANLSHLAEDYPGGPDPTNPASAYAEGKRLAELLCTIYARRYGVQATIARCFAFVGPHLPLDAHFAIGNFIRDGLRGGPIHLTGDGTPVRSYLYAGDLSIWLWTILCRGMVGRAYNVGSMEAISVLKAAETVSAAFSPAPPVHVARPASPSKRAERYVPDTARARIELGLEQTIALPEAIERTISWHGCVGARRCL